MTAMRFKVGDTVVVRDDLIVDEMYGNLYYTYTMNEQVKRFGRTLTVASSQGQCYMLTDNHEHLIDYFTDEMLVLPPTRRVYEVGECAVIRDDLSCSRLYNDMSVSGSMTGFRGKVVTIASVEYEPDREVYRIREDGGDWCWTIDMFYAPYGEEADPKPPTPKKEKKDPQKRVQVDTIIDFVERLMEDKSKQIGEDSLCEDFAWWGGVAETCEDILKELKRLKGEK